MKLLVKYNSWDVHPKQTHSLLRIVRYVFAVKPKSGGHGVVLQKIPYRNTAKRETIDGIRLQKMNYADVVKHLD